MRRVLTRTAPRPALQTTIGFVLLFAVIALWSISTPRYAAPDEPVQAVKAAATARGELIGKDAASDVNSAVVFTVPATIARAPDPGCFAFKPWVPASCSAPWHAYDGLLQATTYVGRYPPLYYFVVGLPSLVTSSATVLYWMRLVSAALSALFLAAAFVSATQVQRGRWVVVGTALAVTPMEVFIAGMVNPSGLEISAALCLWTSGLALFTGPDPAHRRRLVVWSSVSAAVLVQMRGLSPLLLAVIAVTLFAVVGWRPVRAAARRRDVQVGAAVVAACAAFAVVWILADGTLRVQSSGRPVPANASDIDVLHFALNQVGLNTPQLLGVFGWLDTYMPGWCYHVWEAAVLVLGAGVLARRRWRLAAVVVALVGATVAVPTLLAYSQAHKYGIVGEGRYILPVAVGVPVLCAYGWSWGRARAGWLFAVALVLGLAAALVQTAGFVQALHRYRTGIDAPVWVRNAAWAPPLPWLVAIVAFAVLQGALLLWWLRLAGFGPRADTSAEPVRLEVSL
ncbi:MAG: hypothetical protein JWO57_1018 [Pseudonocardiales bacterium]|nr:hypothetical protein [Pseudonocardiales bacterium]